jgi:hypothetical protein
MCAPMGMRKILFVLSVLVLNVACAASPSAQQDAGPVGSGKDATATDTGVFSTGTDATTSGDTASDTSSSSHEDSGVSDSTTPVEASPHDGAAPLTDAQAFSLGMASCSATPPPGAPHASPPKAYSQGTCPTLMPGTNNIVSATGMRDFILVVPDNFDPTREHPPLAFLWHWLGANANSFLTTADVQDATNRLRFIAVIPDDPGDLKFDWPFSSVDLCSTNTTCDCECRFQEELTFFDDMLSCVSAQYPVNLDCVSSVGVSAGALWTAQLGPWRSEYISAMEVLSGGIGDTTVGGTPNLNSLPDSVVYGWQPETHVMPNLVLWGGPDDWCLLEFQPASQNLEKGIESQGGFVEECIHNCGHAVPPFAAPPDGGQFDIMWDFLADHPYWLPPGESPYQVNGLPVGTPDWCAIGAGNAHIRDGGCPDGDLPYVGECF